ncbi:GbsR/MarR family transcriptional regulator [Aeromicrobium sp. CF4.19]|uniref:GbsR/MarR family transcriptional regulator n=1 Tax=Aeromicrobium sp. CF4.19 TaxID=3373082 RepID=UPI003EE6CF80
MPSDHAEFVERLALQLSTAGMQRMGARVFATLLLAPAGGHTAAEIGDALGASAGAVSGATRYLTQMGLADRRRTPGERSDRFTVRGSSWGESMVARSQQVRGWAETMDDGISSTDDPAALERLRESRDFFHFFADRMTDLVQEWRQVRDSPS